MSHRFVYMWVIGCLIVSTVVFVMLHLQFFIVCLLRKELSVFKNICINRHVVIISNNNHICFRIQQSCLCLCPFQLRSLSFLHFQLGCFLFLRIHRIWRPVLPNQLNGSPASSVHQQTTHAEKKVPIK